MRAAVLTISSSRSAGEGREDASGPALELLARRLGAEQVRRELVADSFAQIAACLRECVDGGSDLVLTTGGTGLTPDDVTPEATASVIEREVPGIAEAIRLASREHTPYWMLSRARAGACGSALIVNFPGSPRAIAQVTGELEPALRHALALLAAGAGTAAH